MANLPSPRQSANLRKRPVTGRTARQFRLARPDNRAERNNKPAFRRKNFLQGFHAYPDDHDWFCGWCDSEVHHARAQRTSGFILTTILGIVGAFVAAFLGQGLGWYRREGPADWRCHRRHCGAVFLQRYCWSSPCFLISATSRKRGGYRRTQINSLIHCDRSNLADSPFGLKSPLAPIATLAAPSQRSLTFCD